MKAAVRIALVTCLVVAAAAGPVAVSRYRTHSASQTGAVRRVAAPKHPISYAGVGAIVSAPPGTAKPVFTQSEVLRMIPGDDFVQTVSGGSSPSTISLVMYENAFGLTHPGRPDTPSVPNQLAWLITSPGAPMSQGAGGPGYGPSVSPSVSLDAGPPLVCRSYIAVSATSGKDLDGFSLCE